MEIANTISNNLNLNNELEQKQNNFLQSSLWNLINAGLNTGIRVLLPNFIEEQVIEIKDAILNGKFKEESKQAIESAIEIGKKVTGIVKENFENISQAQNAIRNGGLIDSISNVLNSSINTAVKQNLIPSSVGDAIRKGKNEILNKIEENIENNFASQISSMEKLTSYTQNWKQYYQEKDFTKMEKEYKKIKQVLKETLPLENTLKQARTLENIHLLIKNNGKNFELSQEEKELAKTLAE